VLVRHALYQLSYASLTHESISQGVRIVNKYCPSRRFVIYISEYR